MAEFPNVPSTWRNKRGGGSILQERISRASQDFFKLCHLEHIFPFFIFLSVITIVFICEIKIITKCRVEGITARVSFITMGPLSRTGFSVSNSKVKKKSHHFIRACITVSFKMLLHFKVTWKLHEIANFPNDPLWWRGKTTSLPCVSFLRARDSQLLPLDPSILRHVLTFCVLL